MPGPVGFFDTLEERDYENSRCERDLCRSRIDSPFWAGCHPLLEHMRVFTTATDLLSSQTPTGHKNLTKTIKTSVFFAVLLVVTTDLM
jgi:hypothetical protein